MAMFTTVGSLTSVVDSISSLPMLGSFFVVFHLGSQFVLSHDLSPIYFAYAGSMIALMGS